MTDDLRQALTDTLLRFKGRTFNKETLGEIEYAANDCIYQRMVAYGIPEDYARMVMADAFNWQPND